MKRILNEKEKNSALSIGCVLIGAGVALIWGWPVLLVIVGIVFICVSI